MSSANVRRYGLIGAGVMGQKHIRSLAFVDGANLVAIAEPNDRPLNQTLKILKTSPFKPAIYSEWQDMIASANLEAVILATPSVMHHEMLLQLMPSELAILVEGPMCSNLKDAQRIAGMAAKRQSLFHVGLGHRYDPAVARFLERLQAGDAGSPAMLSISDHPPTCPEIAVDGEIPAVDLSATLVEKCGHLFDLMRLVLKDEPVRIYASAGMIAAAPDDIDGDQMDRPLDNAYVIVDFGKGARAHLDFCLFAGGFAHEEDISVIGDAGKLQAQIPASVVTYSPRAPSGIEREDVGVAADIQAGGHDLGATINHLREFHRAMATGAPPPVSAQAGLRSLEMSLAAQASAASGEVVTL